MSDGRAKLKLTATALRLRRQHPDLFAKGTYKPLVAAGKNASHLFGFSRALGDQQVAAITPRWVSRLVQADAGLAVGTIWGDTTVALPAGSWRNLLDGQPLTSNRVSDVFARWPVALLVAGV